MQIIHIHTHTHNTDNRSKHRLVVHSGIHVWSTDEEFELYCIELADENHRTRIFDDGLRLRLQLMWAAKNRSQSLKVSAKGGIGLRALDSGCILKTIYDLPGVPIVCGVPRVYDGIYTGIMDIISAAGAQKKSLFHISKLRNLEKGLRQEEASPLMDNLVFDKDLTEKIKRDLEIELEAKVNKKVQENKDWILKKLGDANPDLKLDIGDFCSALSSGEDDNGTLLTQAGTSS